MEKLFVTGGNGFIGSRVVRQLTQKGYAVRCLLRPTSRTERIDDLLLEGKIERHLGDLREPETLRQGMVDCVGVIHLASISNWSDIQSPLMPEIVLGGTQNMLEAAQNNGVKRFVFISSAAALGGTEDPVTLKEAAKADALSDFEGANKKGLAYAWAKLQAEALCLKANHTGLPAIIVNPAEVYGPDDDDLVTAGNLVDFSRSNPVFISQGGLNVVHIDDVTQGIIAAYERGKPGERYILGGDNLTLRAFAELTLEILGQSKKVISVPKKLLLGLAWLGQRSSLPLPFEPAVIPYAIRYWFVDNAKARQELDLEFRSARDTLEPTLAWLQETGYI
ncbi:MAG: NAD-dependent epimerase/dehydratase family protein [Chloroflexota bacterium]